MIRKADRSDLIRIAEIYVFNNRVNYYPIFKDEHYSFKYMSVDNIIDEYFGKEEILINTYVYDDGIIRGFMELRNEEIYKFYVEPMLQGRGIGKNMMEYAIEHNGANFLWAIEKNYRAIRFYERFGFVPSEERKLEEGTSEYLVKLIRYEK